MARTLNIFSSLSEKNSIILKLSLPIILSATIVGCSPLGGGSLQKRAIKLSVGLQKAYNVPADTSYRLSPAIIQSAEQNQIDPLLLAALIRQESSFRSTAVSPAGAVGLTQVMPKYWQDTCGSDLYDENTNISCGAYILNKYHQSAGKWPKTLAYYNVGPTAYETQRKMRKQGKKYAKQVKQHQKELKKAL